MDCNEAIQNYQCTGCLFGPFEECFEQSPHSRSCIKHKPATLISSIGTILLGLPKGFNRLGDAKERCINIFTDFEDFKNFYTEYNKLNVPVWKYLDNLKNTIISVYLPRVNVTSVHIFLGDVRSKIDCMEITDTDLKEWD